jgi:NAD(P)-dependent dehydrogenase (short-subunit alcohol dehydrogenase family)
MAVVLVTGCSSGFGLLTACELARRGDTVFASMRDLGKRAALDAAVAALGRGEDERVGVGVGSVEVLELDVIDDRSVAAAVAAVLDRAGRLDVVVNNAGVATGGAVEELPLAEVEAVFATNVFGPLRVTRAALPAMRAQGRGHIVNVTSLAAFVAPPFMGAYAASKHATDALGEALAVEVRPYGIAVTNVAPAAYHTPMVSGVDAVHEAIDDASPYADALRQVLSSHRRSMVGSGPAEEVAVAIADAIHADPPPGRVVVPAGQSFIVQARGATPPEQLRDLLASSYGLT